MVQAESDTTVGTLREERREGLLAFWVGPFASSGPRRAERCPVRASTDANGDVRPTARCGGSQACDGATVARAGCLDDDVRASATARLGQKASVSGNG
jgi:hypothetical protein